MAKIEGIDLLTANLGDFTGLDVFNTISGSIYGNAGTVTNGVYTSGNQTIGGIKTFSSNIAGNISGNSATVTNGVYTSGDQTITGIKTFSTVAITGGPTLNTNGIAMNIHSITGTYNITPYQNGTRDVGSNALHYNAVWADHIVTNGRNMSFHIDGTANDNAIHMGISASANYAQGAFIELYGNLNAGGGDLRLGAGGGRLLLYAGSQSSQNAIRWAISNTGQLASNNAGGNQNYFTITATSASYNSRIQELKASRSPTTSFYHLASTSATDVQHIMDGAGNMWIDGTLFQNQPDYAEYFELTQSGSVELGEAVVLDEDRVRPYDSQIDSDTDIIGVVRPDGNATTVNHPLNWPGKYEKNDFGQYILDENEDRTITAEYDPEQEYIYRSQRDEWVVIGLMGQVTVLKTSTKHPNWKKMKDISATLELWFIK